jgi:hypothetical protein
MNENAFKCQLASSISTMEQFKIIPRTLQNAFIKQNNTRYA